MLITTSTVGTGKQKKLSKVLLERFPRILANLFLFLANKTRNLLIKVILRRFSVTNVVGKNIFFYLFIILIIIVY